MAATSERLDIMKFSKEAGYKHSYKYCMNSLVHINNYKHSSGVELQDYVRWYPRGRRIHPL